MTSGRKLANVKRISQQFDANQDSGINKEEKVTNRDNCLRAEEMRSLVVAHHPKVEFTNEHLNSLVDEFFQTYSSYILTGRKVSLFWGFSKCTMGEKVSIFRGPRWRCKRHWSRFCYTLALNSWRRGWTGMGLKLIC